MLRESEMICITTSTFISVCWHPSLFSVLTCLMNCSVPLPVHASSHMPIRTFPDLFKVFSLPTTYIVPAICMTFWGLVHSSIVFTMFLWAAFVFLYTILGVFLLIYFYHVELFAISAISITAFGTLLLFWLNSACECFYFIFIFIIIIFLWNLLIIS